MLGNAKTRNRSHQHLALLLGNTAMLLCPCASHLIRLDKCVDTHSKEFNILTSSTCKRTHTKKGKSGDPTHKTKGLSVMQLKMISVF